MAAAWLDGAIPRRARPSINIAATARQTAITLTMRREFMAGLLFRRGETWGSIWLGQVLLILSNSNNLARLRQKLRRPESSRWRNRNTKPKANNRLELLRSYFNVDPSPESLPSGYET
jgi:hypothetical protein